MHQQYLPIIFKFVDPPHYHKNHKELGFMVFNATVNNISVLSWQSVLLVEETRVPRENHCPATSH